MSEWVVGSACSVIVLVVKNKNKIVNEMMVMKL